jgi:hypothetical protein
MYAKLYKLLTPRIGHDAARAAMVNQFTKVILVVVGLAAVAFSYTGGEHSSLVLVSLALRILFALLAVVYTKIRVAKAISKYLSTRVNWPEIPAYSPIEKFDEWLKNKKNLK